MSINLSVIYKPMETRASNIKGWKTMTKSELANLYCDYDEAGDTDMAECAFAALMCKYEYMVTYMYERNKNLKLPIEEYTSWEFQALWEALKARKWRDPSTSVSKHENGAERCFSTWFDTIRLRYYKSSNCDSRRIDFRTESLDELIESFGDSTDGLGEESLGVSIDNHDDVVGDIVLHLISEDKLMQAVIVDGIASDSTHDVYKEPYTYRDEYLQKDITIKRIHNILNKKKLITRIKNSNKPDFVRYFSNKYGVDVEVMKSFGKMAFRCSCSKLGTIIDESLKFLKNDATVVESLRG